MRHRSGWLLVAIVTTGLIYLPGLSGEFIYDDSTNFEALSDWVEGQIGWQAVILEHTAGPFGRPLAMLTFLSNAALTGMNPFWFKFTNLILHLLIGLVVYQVLLRLSRLDQLLSRSPETTALLLTSVWLMHPMLVGTVLYVVQRMAMLSVLFMLLALLAYLVGRQRIENGSTRSSACWIFIGVPVFTLLGALSKENGLLAPLLCAVVEWVYFRPGSGRRRPALVRAFLWISIALPAAAGLALLLLRPEFFLQGFDNRAFSMSERLLTQGRVLFDYIGNLLLPIGPSMSLFRDDYTISTGLFSPWTTAVALLGWTSILGLAIWLRDRIPAFTAGVGIFLVGHAMESSLLPLMLYFEHRNYLPAIGAFLAVFGLLSWSLQRLQGKMTNPALLARTTFGAVLVVLAAATFARASLWSSNAAILRQSLDQYPDALAMRLGLAELEMNRIPPNLTAAQAHYRHLLDLERPSVRLIGAMGLVASSCYAGVPTEQTALDTLQTERPDTLESDFLGAITALTNSILNSDCAAIRPEELAERITRFIDDRPLDPNSPFIWQLRYRAAQLFEHAGKIDLAAEQASLAWHGQRDQVAVGVMLMRLSLALGDAEELTRIHATLSKLIDANDDYGHSLLREYRPHLMKRNTRK